MGRSTIAAMLECTHLRDLRVDPVAHPRPQPHLSSASGVVRAGGLLYFVADDEHHLGVVATDAAMDTPVRLHRLRAGDLPADKAQRKAAKPDLEALVLLPTPRSLLALGSGSTPARERGFLLPLAPDATAGAAREIDLRPLYAPLRGRHADLNIEGACVAGERLLLLQRANAGSPVNACIAFGLDAITTWLGGDVHVPPPLQVLTLELGAAAGVPYGWTDATALPDGGWVFTAVAEDTRDSYADGPCAGSALGIVSADGVLQDMLPVRGAPKLEGVTLDAAGDLLLVTDADDPARPSQLLHVAWPFSCAKPAPP